MKFQCPAKINLFLEVTGRRSNGYHLLATIFTKINIYDVLDMEFCNGEKPTLEIVDELGAAPLSAGPDNLVLRAAEAAYKTFRIKRGVKIILTKRIPMGAGLGGGSSDAAGTLLGLTKLLGIELTAARRAKLERIAVKLGADVPFFLKEANFCVGRGIGERLKPLKVGGTMPYMILAWPGFESPTAPAFKALRLAPRPEILTRLSQLDKLIKRIRLGRPYTEWGPLLFNRLEQSETPVLKQVAQARRLLEAAGAKSVRMSGSGSSVFGFVDSYADGEKVMRRLGPYPWKVYLTSCLG